MYAKLIFGWGIEMKIRDNYTCPLEIVHDLVKGKWKTILIFQLRHGTRTFTELKNGIKGISEKMLLQQIKEMQEFGIINKTSKEGYPLRAEYALTDRGVQLLEAVLIMQDIGVSYMLEQGQKELLEQKGILDKITTPVNC